jgi:hypothetical protein
MRGIGAVATIAGALLTAASVDAQTPADSLGALDTLFAQPGRTPISYITSYDRDVSSGTWTQSLSYNIVRSRVAFSTNGSYSTVDQLNRQGMGAGVGGISGRLDFRATKNWLVSADGRFNKAASRDIANESSQRQNRMKITTEYNLAPWRSLGIRGVLSSEVQEDHSLSSRPLGQGLMRLFTITNANGDSVGVDTFFVLRDSTLTSGREDGLSGQVDWKPRAWFRMLTTASGNRIRPKTTSHLGGFAQGSTQFDNRVELVRGSVPNDNTQYQTRLTYTGPRGLSTLLSLKRIRSDQLYYDKTALRQELYSVDQRGGNLHIEQSPLRGMTVTLDGVLNRFFSQYRFRGNRNSLVNSKSIKANVFFNPSPSSRAGLQFDVNHNRNTRQQNGNGTNVTRFLQATGGHRLSRKLALDGVATASITSFEYQNADSVLDQDNARAYLNVGGSYQVSDRCSTLVHFSASRGHSVAIDPTRSSNNNVQTTYQMDAVLRLGVTPRIRINQNYILNAVYQIYDEVSAESKNTLSRIRRIDTTVSDSLFSFATLQLIHNFLSRDFGAFTKQPGGDRRVYRVTSETFVQTVSATLTVKPAAGVNFAATQSLSNSRIFGVGSQTVNNRWNLAVGATIDRTILGDASLSGSVQHIGAYDERRAPGDGLNEQDDWIAGVTLAKNF